ncbi:hypothetical protein ON010_g3837 [Phytophthora cinnamomi]|nr:hypothetical protein ON010_g3837 [Phytophthora cinnamomi]
MASLPPPTSIPGIAVDEVLIIPEIQDLLMADASDDAQGTSSSGDNDTGDIEGAGYLAEAPARSEAVAFEEQLDGEFRPQKTTRSIPECIVATTAHAETAGQVASPQQDMQQQQNNPPSSSTAPDVPNVSSTGQQHIQRMSHADIDGLCYKLQARTASLGDDKHEKVRCSSPAEGADPGPPSRVVSPAPSGSAAEAVRAAARCGPGEGAPGAPTGGRRSLGPAARRRAGGTGLGEAASLPSLAVSSTSMSH